MKTDPDLFVAMRSYFTENSWIQTGGRLPNAHELTRHHDIHLPEGKPLDWDELLAQTVSEPMSILLVHPRAPMLLRLALEHFWRGVTELGDASRLIPDNIRQIDVVPLRAPDGFEQIAQVAYKQETHLVFAAQWLIWAWSWQDVNSRVSALQELSASPVLKSADHELYQAALVELCIQILRYRVPLVFTIE